MATYPLQNAALDGLDVAFAAVAGTNVSPDKFRLPTDKDVVLRIKNGDASDHTATIKAQNPCNQGSLHDTVVTIPAGTERSIGPIPRQFYAGTDGMAEVYYDATTSVTAAAVAVA
ncbi:MAG TPA: hypothetical protein VFK80_00235 [Limnochordia bacterium]|nr:hypothetical protein [Limnochordia bacterium]